MYMVSSREESPGNPTGWHVVSRQSGVTRQFTMGATGELVCDKGDGSRAPTHPPTHSPTHSLTHSLTHSPQHDSLIKYMLDRPRAVEPVSLGCVVRVNGFVLVVEGGGGG
jgi:hypothetical protein